jgi:hypothetical protein
MDDRLTVLKAIDIAIDAMDMTAIDEELRKLPSLGQQGVLPENPIAFAARIQKFNKEKEKLSVKRLKKPLKVLLIAAAVAVLTAGSVYAASAYWNTYVRFQNINDADDYVIIGLPDESVEIMDIVLKAPDENGKLVEIFNSKNKGIVKSKVLQP